MNHGHLKTKTKSKLVQVARIITSDKVRSEVKKVEQRKAEKLEKRFNKEKKKSCREAKKEKTHGTESTFLNDERIDEFEENEEPCSSAILGCIKLEITLR